MLVKYVDCLIIFHLLSHIKTEDDGKQLSKSIRAKIKKQLFYFCHYPIDYEEYKNQLTDWVMKKHDYTNNILMNENTSDAEVNIANFNLLTDFASERIKKLCSFIEIKDIDYFSYEEFSEIVNLNIDNGNFYVSYIFFEPLSANDFINLLSIYLVDFNK